MTDMMRAMAITRAGIELLQVPKPVPRKGEVCVKVVAAAVNAAEQVVMSGSFVGRFLHAKVTPLILGWDFAGKIDSIGEGVQDITEGIEVWGHLPYSMATKQGTYAEYITLSRSDLAIRPKEVPYHIAAATATVAMTSLQSLRDEGRLHEGHKVMIIGAGGGVGSLAVGIAKRLGGEVTAVCSTKDVDRVRGYGADVIIDRKKSNPLEVRDTFDIIFDTPNVYSFGRSAKMLQKGGSYVTTLPDFGLLTGMMGALLTSKHCRFVQVESKRRDLELVGGWLGDGLQVPIDSRYKIADLGVALKRQTDPGRIGRVVVDVENGWP